MVQMSDATLAEWPDVIPHNSREAKRNSEYMHERIAAEQRLIVQKVEHSRAGCCPDYLCVRRWRQSS